MSLINTRLENFRAASPTDKNEARPSRWGAFDEFARQSQNPNGIISDDLKEKALRAVGSTLEIPVIDYESLSISSTTLPVTITGNPSTSQLQAVTFTNYYFGFRIFPALHANNEISMQREFNRKMEQYVYKLLDTLDTAAIAKLEAEKTQVLGDTLGGRYSLVSDVVVAPLAEQDNVVGDINPLMAGNDYFGKLNIIANGSMESHVRNRLLEKGEFNSENKTYQYNDKSFAFTNNLSNAAGHKATAYVVEDGNVGFLQQFSPDCLMGHSTTSGYSWDIATLPFANIPIGTMYYESAVDGSSLSGAASAHLTATKAQHYGFHTAIAWVSSYNSDAATRANPIMKLAIKTT